MSSHQIVSSALASVLALGLVGPAAAQSKEKCFAIAKAGQNDCADLADRHSCAGQAKEDLSPAEWKYLATGTCKEMKGLTIREAMDKVEATKKKS